MAPNYEQLAYLYASDATAHDQVTIAKIDADANDVPGDIQGFPIFKFFPAGSKELPLLYDGSWTIESSADFVRDNCIHKWILTTKPVIRQYSIWSKRRRIWHELIV